MVYISKESIERIIIFYTHAYHNHPERGVSFFQSYALRVLDDLTSYAMQHMQKSSGPTLMVWDTNAWQKYNSQSFPWYYAIAHDGENAYVEASEQEKNVAEDAPHDTGFTASVPANNYTYYATGGCGFDVVMRKVKDESGTERPLFNFRKRGRIIFYMDFTNYLQFRRGKAYGWGTNGIKYELFSNGKIRKSVSESQINRIKQIITEEIKRTLADCTRIKKPNKKKLDKNKL